MDIERSHKANILAVDDEPVARQQMAYQLSALGYRAEVAASASEAQEILAREGPGAFDCLITDCWMPDQTGLDLLIWLKDYDHTLASIVTSSGADKAVITQTLRGGASDFLEKPVFRRELEAALNRAIQSTGRRRRHAATRSAVREAGLVQRRMNNLGIADEFPVDLTICYHPCHGAGGDSVACFVLDANRILVVVADVSGHDLKSAFISAYFQGMLRAMVEQNVPIASILDSFNRFLMKEWNGTSGSEDDGAAEITSLSVCSVFIDLQSGSVRLLNGGFPLPNGIDGLGRPRPCGEAGGYPLGWVDPHPLAELSFAVDRAGRLIVWTDGLEEFAYKLQISEWSLAFGILEAKRKRQKPAWLADAPDDILVALIGLERTCPQKSGEQSHFPILAESYEKEQAGEIDRIQTGWRRSLAFAFPDLPHNRLSDIVLCVREAVMNGLLHGCSGVSDRCRLAVIFDGRLRQLRIEVSDPGLGHSFDWQRHAREELAEAHRGLLLMHRIPQRVEEESSGATIRMFFALQHDLNEVVNVL